MSVPSSRARWPAPGPADLRSPNAPVAGDHGAQRHFDEPSRDEPACRAGRFVPELSGWWTQLESHAGASRRDRSTVLRVRSAVDRFFDRIVRPRLRVLGRSISSFQVLGTSGLASAILLGVFLTVIQGLSLGILAVLIASSCATFLALAMGTKIVTGEEKLIYYHHEVGILLVAGVVLRLLDQPVLAYLELTLLAVGMFLAWGRVGCLMVGCCHGRPHVWGVRYGTAHADDGFPSHLTGVRLFPIQLLESFTVLGTVVWGTLLIVRGAPSGEALVLYVMGYGAARFAFEFARGDADRPYLAGFSEAQWTSLLLMAIALGAALRGDLPLHAWHLVSVGLVAACVMAVAWRRRLASVPMHQILHAQHLDEIARVLRAIRDPREKGIEADPEHECTLREDRLAERQNEAMEGILIGTTSQGFQLSAGTTDDDSGVLSHYGLSRRGDALAAPVARALGRLILRLEHPNAPGHLVSRRPGLFHLLVRLGNLDRGEPKPPRRR